MRDSFVDRVLLHEGFRERPYKDTVGVWTIGHGLTYITEEESEWIVRKRLATIEKLLSVAIQDFLRLPIEAREVLIEMGYQMGAQGALNFRRTIKYMQDSEWEEAAEAMMESKWASQTPNRAKALSEIIRSLAR